MEWLDLPDPASQEYEDPYRNLDQDTLEDVIEVARLRAMQEQAGSLAGEDALRLEERLASLEEQGVDADWLISQRWIVAERRERAATLGNAAFDGQEITLSGFAISAPTEEDGTSVLYLVELPGLCSHMPPPAPNQLVQVRLAEEWTPEYLHQPVRVTGRMKIDPTDKVFQVVDGDVAMKATWQLEAAAVEDFRPDPRKMGANSEWIEQLRAGLRASKTAPHKQGE
ncbi:DUF3299 domain-containing protein [Tropicimonas marinistellae]|uniref:DUF3299 domain-containing protein n=1 Tax=Tropicimonas marinistellae TaxID=1739787 RepID=UPI00137358F1|nr:DUF3299 domain-containing protein [Tropicimonas marinistellae]